MSNIFANVNRMDTGAKVFFVAIGLLILLAYSLENQPAAQQTTQTQTPAPAPTTAAPVAEPSPQPKLPVITPKKKSETIAKSVAKENNPQSIPSTAPDADAISPAVEAQPVVPNPSAVAPSNPAIATAPEVSTPITPEPIEAPPAGYFTVGSTKDDVLRTQGSPKGMNENRWAYGLSTVEFQNGRVVTWNESPLNPLRATLLPKNRSDASAARTRGFFTIGSTKDEVLGTQGTPTRFTDSHWTYGLSSVEFSGGAVAGWNESPLNTLRARMLPADQAASAAAKTRGFFTIGSSKDEVLGVQGTPTRFTDTHWTYGLSSVEFQSGVVRTWNVSPLNPLRAALIPQNSEVASAARARGYFTIGSSKDEVLGVQGTPSRFTDTYWSYGLSSVTFLNDRVTNWNSSPLNPLKARREP